MRNNETQAIEAIEEEEQTMAKNNINTGETQGPPDYGRSLHIALANLVVAVDHTPYLGSPIEWAVRFDGAIEQAKSVLDGSKEKYGYWPPVPVANGTGDGGGAKLLKQTMMEATND